MGGDSADAPRLSIISILRRIILQFSQLLGSKDGCAKE